MAKLCDLTSCFMQAFLKANPNSLVDSNGYLRSEYEAELARRALPVISSQDNGVPDPRTYRPQFECTGEVALPAFESPDEQLGIVEFTADGKYEVYEPIIAPPDLPQPVEPLQVNDAVPTQVVPVSASVETPTKTEIAPTEEPIKLDDITPELREQIHSEVDKGWEIAPDVTAQDLGANESPAESEVKEDLAADTVYISEHEVEPAETPELEGPDLHNIHE